MEEILFLGGLLCALSFVLCLVVTAGQACGWAYRKGVRDPARKRATERSVQQRRREEAARAAAADRLHKAREAKILECQLFFDLNRPELEPRYSAAQFWEYVDSYLRPAPTPADCERRAAQLLAHLQAHLRAAGGGGADDSVGGLHAWYTARKADVESLDVPDDIREALLTRLRLNYVDRLQRTLGDA